MRIMFIAAIVATALLAGCDWTTRAKPDGNVADLYLPKQIDFHPLTATMSFEDAGAAGIDVRLKAIDQFGDPTKAFGVYRFETYDYRPHESDPRGGRLEVWVQDLSDPDKNLAHWMNAHKTYRFRLAWRKPVPTGQKFVLAATFQGPDDGPRLFAQKVIVSGD